MTIRGRHIAWVCLAICLALIPAGIVRHVPVAAFFGISGTCFATFYLRRTRVRLTDPRDARRAVLVLWDLLAEAAPDALRATQAQGCCGCGDWFADVCTPPWEGSKTGESYCWGCVKRLRVTDYTVLAEHEWSER